MSTLWTTIYDYILNCKQLVAREEPLESRCLYRDRRNPVLQMYSASIIVARARLLRDLRVFFDKVTNIMPPSAAAQ
jgi:hypothetical protein